MEAFYVYVATKIEAIRKGETPGGGKIKVVNIHELKTPGFWQAVLAEFLASFFFVYLGCAAATFEVGSVSKQIKVAFAFGLAIMAMIQMIGHVSGGHINPAVSVAMALVGKISVFRALLYVIAQAGGGVLGGLVLKSVSPASFHDNLGVTQVSDLMTPAQGFGVEFLLTFVLVAVIFGTVDSNRAALGSPAFHIGLTVSLLHLAGISFTGSSMNPTRSLGSAVASNYWNNHWVYWAGPLSGGAVAALVYKFLLNPYKKTPSFDSAINTMLQDGNMVAIPRDYFKEQKPKDVITSTSQL